MDEILRKDIEENSETYKEEYTDLPPEVKDKLEWFKDQKLGIIFHWGLYAEAGIVESWQLSEEDEWARAKGSWRSSLDKLRKDYWNLNKQFAPEQFDPDKWAELSKKAGFKYMIFTTKHHDGFNMYDTDFSDYKITGEESAFKDNQNADIFKRVAEAFREKELAVGAYYSKADWYSPFYWVPGQHAKGRTASYDPDKQPDMWTNYKDFVHNQLEEIARDYGPIDITWLDAGWVRDGRTNENLNMDEIARKMRQYNSSMLIVDRSVGGIHENYVTPERKIPDTAPSKAWESNIPHAKNWGFVPNDIYKSDEEIISALIKVVAMGGNLIIGVGPKPDGTLPEQSVKLMKILGIWLDSYGEGIYGTRPYVITEMNNWFFTKKESTIYVYSIPSAENKEHVLTLSDIDVEKDAVIIDLKTQQPVSVIEGQLINRDNIIKGFKIEQGRK